MGSVTKCHACHMKRTWMLPSATPATQNEDGRHQVPHLPRETKVDVAKCDACHAKRRWMSPSATAATRNEGACHQVPRLPRETKVHVAKCHACHAKYRGVTGDQARPSAPMRNKCHACHAKRRWMSPSATPATRNEDGCHQVPRLPRKTKVDVAKRRACHVGGRWMSSSATPAMQSAAADV